MPKNKRKQPSIQEVLERPWCYYCERDFDDLKILISHQKAKHYKCDRCQRRLNTAGGLSVHMSQVHKEPLSHIENALPNRSGIDVEIFGMEGMPEDVINAHNERVTQEYYTSEAAHRAATGNPAPGGGQGNNESKKRKIESAEDIKKRLAEHKAKKAAEAAGQDTSVGTPQSQTASPHNAQLPSSFQPPQAAPGQQSAAPGTPQPGFGQGYAQPPTSGPPQSYGQPPVSGPPQPYGHSPSVGPPSQGFGQPHGFGPSQPYGQSPVPYQGPQSGQFGGYPPQYQGYPPPGQSGQAPPQYSPPQQFGGPMAPAGFASGPPGQFSGPPPNQMPHAVSPFPPQQQFNQRPPPSGSPVGGPMNGGALPQRQNSLPSAPGLPQRPSFNAPQVSRSQLQGMHTGQTTGSLPQGQPSHEASAISSSVDDLISTAQRDAAAAEKTATLPGKSPEPVKPVSTNGTPKAAQNGPAAAPATTAPTEATEGKKAKKAQRLVYTDQQASPEEKMARMSRYSFTPRKGGETVLGPPEAAVTGPAHGPDDVGDAVQG